MIRRIPTSAADLLRGYVPPAPQALPPSNNGLADILAGLARPKPPADAIATYLASIQDGRSPFGSLAPSVPPTPSVDSLTRYYLTTPAATLLGSLPPTPAVRYAPVKRRAYFAFKYSDVMRVNNVRQAWKIDHPDSGIMRSFYDSSLWEDRKLESDTSLKELMRGAVRYTSAVCVLIGTDTWSSRWVKYEIARSVIDKRGLLAVHLNGLNHNQRKQPDPLGFNVLHHLGVYKSSTGNFYLCEKSLVIVNYLTGQREWQWQQYQDYTLAVPLPRYLAEPSVGIVMPLSSGTEEYDFVAQDGHKNIGAWIDRAAQRAGR